MPNFLEQLVAEWYEFQGYFVRRNVHVGKRAMGGYESELDIVAFRPKPAHLVHVEPSMDSDTWEKRDRRFGAKFDAGRRHIPNLLSGFANLPSEIDQIAVFVYGSTKNRSHIGSGRILMISDLMASIRDCLQDRKVLNAAVPEQYTILRALQFAANFWTWPRKEAIRTPSDGRTEA